MTAPRMILLFWVFVTGFSAAQPAPEKALRYHAALLQRPHNTALFDRFFGAWIDEQPVDSLGDFLAKQAAENGGVHWAVLAAYQLRRGKEDAALDALGQGIAAVPGDPALPLDRGKLRLRRLDFPGAREDFARAAGAAAGADEPLALEAAKLTGKAWLREGKTAEAIAAWDALLAAHPGDEDLLEDLVETAAAESETAQALVYAEKLIAASRDPYQKTLRQLRRADLLSRAGRDDDAVQACAATLAQVGDGSWLEREVLAQIDKIFRKQDRIGDLAAELKSLAGTYPQRLAIHRQLAKLEAAQGDTDAAIGRFREILKRSPGEHELREEFVRLLTDAERFEDAAAELAKLIELTPGDANLYLQLAAFRARQDQPDAVAAALEKARALLGNDEPAGLRIAGLLLQYGLTGKGENLLQQLAQAPAASPFALEALAAQYARTGRKEDAIGLLKKASAGPDPDTLLRVAGSISALGEAGVAYETLSARAADFPAEPRFLAAQAQAALAAGKPAEAVPPALKLLRRAKQPGELAEAIRLATRAAAAAGKSAEIRETLAAQPTRTSAETCLLSTLAEAAGDPGAVEKLLDPDPDPVLIRFHAALLDRRGDLPAAIATLTRLGDTPEGQKAAYFKDLADLQQRAGQLPAALVTVQRWKLAAPGDKSAWLAASRLQRDSGKPELAVQTLRQAVGRFEGDADLAAQLAALHDQAGQWPEAEAIYWQLHDAATTPADQTRWAAQLAQLAQRTGTTAALAEKFRDRIRNNRRAPAPLLALAELARVTGDDFRYRELLADVSRLQPKDVPLKLRLASLAEDAGDLREAVAILEEARGADPDEKVRPSLARLYFRLGDAGKALRILKMDSGKSAPDPRMAESLAVEMTDANWTDEAIDFLRTELPGGGDWRTRYLLATLLEADGREDEAMPLFFDLLRTDAEIPGLPTGRTMPFSGISDVASLMRLTSAMQMAYPLAEKQDRGIPLAYRSPFPNLPATAEEVRDLALAHLWKIGRKDSGRPDAAFEVRLRAASPANLDFALDVFATPPGAQPDLTKLLERHPAEPGLFELAAQSGRFFGNQRPPGIVTIRKILEQQEKLPAGTRFSAWARLVELAPEDENAWVSMIAAARDCLAKKNPTSSGPVTGSLMKCLSGKCPEHLRPEIGQLLIDDLAGETGIHALGVLNLAGTPNAWLAKLNATVREFRGKKVPSPGLARISAMLQRQNMGRTRVPTNEPATDGIFEAPDLGNLPYSSLPADVLAMLSAGWKPNAAVKPVLDEQELLARAEEIESPALRAWLVVRGGDDAAVEKALSAVHPPEEECDFQLLKAAVRVAKRDYEGAWTALLAAREAVGNNADQAAAVDISLLATAGEMQAEERIAKREDIEAAFSRCGQVLGQEGSRALAGLAANFRLETLARRFGNAALAPVAPSGVTVQRFARSRMMGVQPPPTIDRVGTFVKAGKHEAAALEVMRRIRLGRQDPLVPKSEPDLNTMVAILGQPGKAELLRIAAPGDTRSRSRKLEYMRVCELLDKPELAVGALDSMLKDRPGDAALTTRLFFAMGPEQMERRVGLLGTACRSRTFFEALLNFTDEMASQKNRGPALAFFETVARWLESADPATLADANLSWVPVHAKRLFYGEFTRDVPSLFVEGATVDSSQVALCQRLARAMIRHAGTAEEGFRLLTAARAWEIPAEELDGLARQALLEGALNPESRAPYFTLEDGTPGGHAATLAFSEHSSAAWLAGRMMGGDHGLFPADFIAAMKDRDAGAGNLVANLGGELREADFPAIWDALFRGGQDTRVARMIRPLVVQRLAAVPGAGTFFAQRIGEIPPGTAIPRFSEGDRESLEIVFAEAIRSAPATGLDALAESICRAVFDGRSSIPAGKTLADSLPQVDFMGEVARHFDADPAAMVRCQGAFLRIGVPLGTSDEPAFRVFHTKRCGSVAEAEEFLASLGWLTDVDVWEPYAGLIQRRQTKDRETTATIEPRLALAFAALSLPRDGFDRDELIARLVARKEGHFGSLMTAAALSTGESRKRLASQAFREAAAELAKLPPERAARFALLEPWLDDGARDLLPR